ncbi:Rap1a/Tai family immunity protein [Stella sp.]|uniref:Rap1a/Tai family immunity protein n=1 Tax=Stella sp. TaxID=2912054 RepID=UPI0035B4EB42
MKRAIAAALAAASLTAAASAGAAVTRDDFLVRNTASLVSLCSVQPQDPMAVQALHFCHGYVAGVADQYQAMGAPRPGEPPPYCLPEPRPSRSQAVEMFLAWAKANPAEAKAEAVDSLFRFARATWPCKR